MWILSFTVTFFNFSHLSSTWQVLICTAVVTVKVDLFTCCVFVYPQVAGECGIIFHAGTVQTLERWWSIPVPLPSRICLPEMVILALILAERHLAFLTCHTCHYPCTSKQKCFLLVDFCCLMAVL